MPGLSVFGWVENLLHKKSSKSICAHDLEALLNKMQHKIVSITGDRPVGLFSIRYIQRVHGAVYITGSQSNNLSCPVLQSMCLHSGNTRYTAVPNAGTYGLPSIPSLARQFTYQSLDKGA